MRRSKLLALIVGLLTIIGLCFASAPADAATSISLGSSCKLSANWTVNVSVRYLNTHGSPSVGTVDYVVFNSPGALNLTNTHSTTVFKNTAGTNQDVGLGSLIRDTSKPGFVYRADTSHSPNTIRRVQFDPSSDDAHFCSFYDQPVNVYSQN